MVELQQSVADGLSDCPILANYIQAFQLTGTKSLIDWVWNYNTIVLDIHEIDMLLSATIGRKDLIRYDPSKYAESWLVIAGGSPIAQPPGILTQQVLFSMEQLTLAARRSHFARILIGDLPFGEVAVWPNWEVFDEVRND